MFTNYRYNLEADTVEEFPSIRGVRRVSEVELTGNCCVTIYKIHSFRGDIKQTLGPGYHGDPHFRKIRSFRYGYCDNPLNVNF